MCKTPCGLCMLLSTTNQNSIETSVFLKNRKEHKYLHFLNPHVKNLKTDLGRQFWGSSKETWEAKNVDVTFAN